MLYFDNLPPTSKQMIKLWFVPLAVVCINVAIANASVGSIAASNALSKWPKRHMRSLIDSFSPDDTVDLVVLSGSDSHEATFASSSSRHQANETKAPRHGSRMVSTWFVLGLWIFAVCAITTAIWVAMRTQTKGDSYHNTSDKTCRVSATCCGDEEDDSAIDTTKGYQRHHHHNSNAIVAAGRFAQLSSTVDRSSEASSVCSLADSDSVNYKSTLPCVDSFVASLERDSSVLDKAEVDDDDEMYSMSMIPTYDDDDNDVELPHHLMKVDGDDFTG